MSLLTEILKFIVAIGAGAITFLVLFAVFGLSIARFQEWRSDR